MNPKQRILAIQLIEKLEKNPDLAKKLNVEINSYKQTKNKEYTNETFCCNRFRDVCRS